MSKGAPNRHLLRLWVIQFLFQQDYNPSEDLAEDLDIFLGAKDKKLSRKMREFFEHRVQGVLQASEELDEQIMRFSTNWDLKRMGGVDRNVLRLSFYELFHCEDVPPVVAVNEAIQLAKELSSDESGKFVNGILDRVIRTLDRPLRHGVQPD